MLAGLFLELSLSMHSQVPCACRDGYGWWTWDVNQSVNPYGSVALGFEHELNSKFSVRVFVRHESAITVNDHGTDSAGAAVAWRPFR